MAASGEITYWCYLVEGVVDGPRDSKLFKVYHDRLMPETVRVEDGGFFMEFDADQEMAVEKSDISRQFACYVYDFIIRINSPAVAARLGDEAPGRRCPGEKVLDLCQKRHCWSIAYRHPGGHRTSNMLDRLIRGMNRYFDHGQHLHGSRVACRRHCRAWALLWNFAP